jgi:hypothetical protein
MHANIVVILKIIQFSEHAHAERKKIISFTMKRQEYIILFFSFSLLMLSVLFKPDADLLSLFVACA